MVEFTYIYIYKGGDLQCEHIYTNRFAFIYIFKAHTYIRQPQCLGYSNHGCWIFLNPHPTSLMFGRFRLFLIIQAPKEQLDALFG